MRARLDVWSGLVSTYQQSPWQSQSVSRDNWVATGRLKDEKGARKRALSINGAAVRHSYRQGCGTGRMKRNVEREVIFFFYRMMSS